LSASESCDERRRRRRRRRRRDGCDLGRTWEAECIEFVGAGARDCIMMAVIANALSTPLE
jgi:hypothetical protein